MPRPFDRVTGTYTGNGSSQTITLGFKPVKLEIVNVTDGDTFYITYEGVSDATGWNISTATAAVAANGATLSTRGFSVGSDASVNENAKVFRYFAFV